MLSRSVVVLSVLSKIPKRNGMYVCMCAVVVVVAAAAAAAVIIVIDGRLRRLFVLLYGGWVCVCVGGCGESERKEKEKKQ